MPRGIMKPGDAGLDAVCPVNWQHPLARGLVAWWLTVPSWHGGGPRWIDLAGGNHGTLTNGPTWAGAVGRPGGFGSLSFDGSDDYVALGTAATFRLARPFTIGLWAKFDAAGNYPGLVLWSVLFNEASTAYGIYCHDASLQLKLLTGGNNVQSARTLSLGVWYRILWVCTATENVLYLNNVGETLAATTDPTAAYGSGDLHFGAYLPGSPGNGQFTGQMDGVSFWSRGLSAAEAALDYREETQGYPNLLRRLPRRTWLAADSGGGSSFSVTAGDSPSTIDAISRLFSGSRTMSDSPLTSDTVARAGGFSRTLSESPQSADSVSRSVSAPRTASDSPSTTDAVTRSFTGSRTTSDSPSTSDNVVRTAAFPRTVTDACTASDAVTRAFTGSRTVADACSTVDDVSGIKGRVVTASDAVSTTDSVTRSLSSVRSTTDSPTTTDSLSRAFVGARSLSDSPLSSSVVTASGGPAVVPPSVFFVGNIQRNVALDGNAQRIVSMNGEAGN